MALIPSTLLANRTARTSFWLVLLVSVLVGAGLAVTANLVMPFLLALLTALFFGVAVQALTHDADQIVAVGSLCIVLGGVALSATLGLAARTTLPLPTDGGIVGILVGISPFVLVATLAFGFTFLALDALVGLDTAKLGMAAVETTFVGLTLGMLGTLWFALHYGVLSRATTVVVQVLRHLRTVATSSIFVLSFAFVAELCVALGALYLLAAMLPDAWLRIADRGGGTITEGGVADGESAAGRPTSAPVSRPRILRYLSLALSSAILLGTIGITALLLARIGMVPWLDRQPFLASLGKALVESAVLHGLLLVTTALSAGGFVVYHGYRRMRVATPGDITHGAGIYVGPGLLAIVLLPVDDQLVTYGTTSLPEGLATILTELAATFGSLAVVLGGLAALTLFTVGMWLAAALPLVSGLLPRETAGSTVGAVCLLSATYAGALVGVPSLLVFTGVAATLFVWDVGENATFLEQQVDVAAPTIQGELIHAAGSGGVALLAVGVVYLASYVPGHLSYSLTPAQLVIVLMFAFVATVGLLLQLRR